MSEAKRSLVCAFIGPDGSGKSTIAIEVFKKISPLIHSDKSQIIHWRPGFLPPLKNIYKPWKWKEVTNTPVTNPHGSKPSGYIFSLVRLIYYLFDFSIGFYFTTYRLLVRNAFVIFDRYYYDIIVDPLRSRISLPQWVIKLFLPFIPKPDVTVYLDASPETLYKRKPELSITEFSRQVREFRDLIPYLSNPVIVSTEKPLDEVVYEVSSEILNKISEKEMDTILFQQRFLFNSPLARDYLALPSKKNCRWIIPINPDLAKKSWDLYLTYSLSGRIYKSVMRFLSSKGLLKFIKSNRLNLQLSNSTNEIASHSLAMTDYSDKLKRVIEEIFKRDDFALAISTGTPGPFRKITAMIIASDGKVLGYVKIGETPLAIERIKHEAETLKLLVNRYSLIEKKKKQDLNFSVPENLYEGEIGNAYVLIQSPVPYEGKSGSRYFNDDYANVLRILIDNTSVKKKFIESEFYKNLKSGIDNYMLSYRELLKQGLYYLEKNIGDKEIIFTLSHGDFAPWNMLWFGKKVFIFDWESSCVESPAGIDLMHFMFQTGFLLKKFKGEKLLYFCINDKPYKMLIKKLKESILDKKILLLIYLLKMAVDEDAPQVLSRKAVERRKLLKLMVIS